MFKDINNIDELYGINGTDEDLKEYKNSKDRLLIKKLVT